MRVAFVMACMVWYVMWWCFLSVISYPPGMDTVFMTRDNPLHGIVSDTPRRGRHEYFGLLYYTWQGLKGFIFDQGMS